MPAGLLLSGNTIDEVVIHPFAPVFEDTFPARGGDDALTLELEQIRPVGFFGSTDVSAATFTLLREAVANTDFGPGLRQLKVSVHLRHKGRSPSGFTAKHMVSYHAYLSALPKITFQKKNAAVSVLWHANIDPSPMLVAGDKVTYASFEILAGEVIAAVKLVRSRLARVKNFDCDRLIGKLSETVATTPRSDRGFRAAVQQGFAAYQARWDREAATKDPWESLDIDWKKFHLKARAPGRSALLGSQRRP